MPTIVGIALSLLMSAQAAAVEIAFFERTFHAADMHTCGVHVSGSADLWFDSFDVGVGIDGGISDGLVDGT